MSQRDPIRVFVTHCFEDSDDYARVFEYLESARNFYYRNCARLEAGPVGGTDEQRREELRRQIGAADGRNCADQPLRAAAGLAGIRAELRQGERQTGRAAAAIWS